MAFLESSEMGGARTTITTDPAVTLDHSNPQQGNKKGPNCIETTSSISTTSAHTGVDSRASPFCEMDDPSLTPSWTAPSMPDRPRAHKERPSYRPTVPNVNDGRKLFVGGLPKDVTATEFFIFFAQYGKVLDSFIVYDRGTGKPRGFGFVVFEDPSVCQMLLQMQNQNGSKSSSLDEDSDENSETLPSPSKLLQIRGRLIELKIAQPRETETIPRQPKTSSQQQYHHHLPNHHHHPYWGNDVGMYDFVTKYPATLPQNTYGMYDPTPMTPIPPSNPMMTPGTPAQAVLDMAHHMLFYAQLLATPSLTNANYEPMLAPCCETSVYEAPGRPTEAPLEAPSILPPLPDVLVSPSKRRSTEAFQIGGATFYPEVPSSPPNTATLPKKKVIASL